ncbi:MAG: hypothetical protein EGR16_10055 [Clostridiales bacterium]|nr:hypothetical protein [Clostridiales bacterium]
MQTIIGAIISAAAAITVCIINANSQNKKILSELDKHNAVQTEQITQLKEQVHKHNNIIERTYKLEKDVAVLNNRESVSEHRIEDLENK